MRQKLLFAVSLLILGLLSGPFNPTYSTAIAQEEDEELGVAILFPSNPLFEEYLELTEDVTDVAEDEWTAEFEKHVLFISASSGNGIVGQISNDIGFLDEMFAGTHDFVVYGVFEFPEGFPLNPTNEAIERGLVLYITDEYLVVVLVDLSNDGEITAFVVFPRVENTTPLAPIYNLESIYGVFFVLQAIEQLNIVETPTPPGEETPVPASPAACPTDLDKVQDVNVTLSSNRSIKTTSDGGGNLYEISVVSPDKLRVESLQDDDIVQASFLAPGESRLANLAGEGRFEEFELDAGERISLLVGGRDKRTCLLADVEASGNNLILTGELFEN